MFVPLKIGDVISNERLMEIFSVANMGGMRYSKLNDVLVLISNHALNRERPDLNPFDDYWEDNVFYYTGEGSLSDQGPKPKRQNKRLAEGNYSALHLFEVFHKGEYTYQGFVVKFRNWPFYGSEHRNGIQPDKNGNYRRVFVFPLKKIQ